jgi:hypothetical protein
MKTLEEIVKQEPVFLNNWKSKIDLISDFENIYMTEFEYLAEKAPYENVQAWEEKKVRMKRVIDEWQPINILFASYETANYSGDAWVLFERGGELWEVSAGHCSCYGVEGQWSPEKVVLPELKNRLLNGRLGDDDYSDNVFKTDLASFLGIELSLSGSEV